jgi:hypothetical protein
MMKPFANFLTLALVSGVEAGVEEPTTQQTSIKINLYCRAPKVVKRRSRMLLCSTSRKEIETRPRKVAFTSAKDGANIGSRLKRLECRRCGGIRSANNKLRYRDCISMSLHSFHSSLRAALCKVASK